MPRTLKRKTSRNSGFSGRPQTQRKRVGPPGADAMSFLQKRRKVHRLQGRQYSAKAFNQSRKNILTKTQRQLRRLSEKSEKGNKTRKVYSAFAVYSISFG
jgi:hypothetical protein